MMQMGQQPRKRTHTKAGALYKAELHNPRQFQNDNRFVPTLFTFTHTELSPARDSMTCKACGSRRDACIVQIVLYIPTPYIQGADPGFSSDQRRGGDVKTIKLGTGFFSLVVDQRKANLACMVCAGGSETIQDKDKQFE